MDMKGLARAVAALCCALCAACSSGERVYDLSDYGILPEPGRDNAPAMARALAEIREACDGERTIVLTLPKGRYEFFPDSAAERTYYISNHDQMNPKRVGLPLEGLRRVVFDGQGSELLFHGRMLPVALTGSSDCVLRNFSVDFPNPQIAQAKVVENDTLRGGLTLELTPWVEYKVGDDRLTVRGRGWELSPVSAIAFEGDTKRVVYQTSDVPADWNGVEEVAPRVIRAPHWKNPRLVPGTVLALRTFERPAPGIFLHRDTRTTVENVRIHYAEGMGLLAQLCEEITLDRFGVCLRGDGDPRYFTTQADATHFSGCKGMILSRDGLYEGMMDDAINIHGTYLKVTRVADDSTLIARYMHPQSYGFDWGEPGDTVRLIRSLTMEYADGLYQIRSIRPTDLPEVKGAKEFEIRLSGGIGSLASLVEEGLGIENLTWTPTVRFAGNVIRNNRARGALFSTPRQTVVEDNLFDHTSGTAILLCGDCNGWYETGACHDVLIRHNRFVNSLTNLFQFTNAIISIYPEIPDLAGQKAYFHSGIRIEDNEFDTFDRPLLYAKSVDGLSFTGNVIRHNSDYPAFHWNSSPFFFQRVTGARIENNQFDGDGFVWERDVREEAR